ncbi:hypothetical protein S7711_11096 [Stachybotrys chartarum IBT 7711]|uniref:Uncharacterized protein n=1 Tax=Stachybotrys chartarum (strain CBS 109288 / IBT 7711) TaxID=1280523 RepID=A0A084ARW1_STACB|nr:hypothetical protein S7711_11096 [Stachybotrys chartarum IBT 7711]KFA46521.1 hypothetical protein S40293_10793 [Stachybotrys chartarum IBT 40293]KFA72463.1 hypothetical protein S40288_11375 [Stachybotrys chartarum IBT 40288]
MKLLLLLPAALAASVGKYDGVPTEVNESILIDFSWCRTYNSSGTCGVAQLNHAQCYNLYDLDLWANDNIQQVSVENGRCVLFERYDCKGDNTQTFVGQNLFVETLCPRPGWNRIASSVKCCGGEPGAYWCAKPSVRPRCKD